MEKKIYILAGGPPENVPDLAPYAEDKQAAWAGVDRGVLHLLKQGIIPEMAFGDFDSVNQEEWGWINRKLQHIRKFQPEKDETDMELALMWAISREPGSDPYSRRYRRAARPCFYQCPFTCA